ncbi:hypothetical protein CRU94_06330 [Arcobacter sp. AHV-9/2010]|uniref:hypothetical protein n=1 Tax=Arcobacter sp. AHV-9/2010 TaxID=2021861 RepID=UPI00100BFDA0|nr:hypothetical protein [Arcobacter sp. CECT 9299]RXJ95343.1 hypothetical protein CRU94_06330 [Arcobacter sp. CECT 9299]
MIKNILKNQKYIDISSKNIKESIEFLLEEKIYFGIVANIKNISFNPKLPEDVLKNLNEYSLFSLAGYTFESAYTNESELFFEAGFGQDNFGSLLKVPFQSIFQIIVDENILVLNLCATIEKENKEPKKNSFDVFKNNPKNRRFN